MTVIETRGLTKFYGKHRGIEDLDLRVEEGDIFGFIGPNGAGKSTTIRTLLGLISPSSGTASVLEKDVASRRTEILARVGYMPSESMFYGRMRVGEVIDLSARLRKKDCAGEAESLCRRLDLDRSKRVEELSLGNRKKLAIVCAMQHRPELYILDEPTSGLDPLIQREFFELLRERSGQGATVFLSSHVLSEIQRSCTKAAIIKEGRLIACGSVEELARTSARRVTLHGVSAPPDGLEVRSVTETGSSVSFLYQGDIKELIKRLAGLPITDMTVTEPDLEEIFLHYYERGGEER